jgi:hypothetical protein
MIPKVIHYCWFGRGQMPPLALKCIESWKKYCPDYELKLWDEDSFDLNLYPYAKEALENRKFAFVTDVVRLYAIYNEGGIYMDTDVEVLKPLDDLLHLSAFSGYESNKDSTFPTGIMASAKGGIWAQEQLAYYDDRHFVKPDGSFDMKTNAQTITDIMVANGFKLTGKYQVYKDDMHCFPKDYFCPKTSTGVLKLTSNSYCIHHFAGSWIKRTPMQKLKKFVTKDILGVALTDKLVQLKRKLKNRK